MLALELPNMLGSQQCYRLGKHLLRPLLSLARYTRPFTSRSEHSVNRPDPTRSHVRYHTCQCRDL